jgi:hypothetical protein
MSDPSPLTPDEIRLVADREFFKTKAAITPKIRAMLESVHDALKQELAGVPLIAPAGFDPDKRQFVKGEHLEDCPYQYLDFPKHFEGDDKFTFRTLFWWGHHVVFALILEGEGLRQYKQNLINRYGPRSAPVSLADALGVEAGAGLHAAVDPRPQVGGCGGALQQTFFQAGAVRADGRSDRPRGTAGAGRTGCAQDHAAGDYRGPVSFPLLTACAFAFGVPRRRSPAHAGTLSLDSRRVL